MAGDSDAAPLAPRSTELKSKGDQAFRGQDFREAIALYSQALELADAEFSKTLLSNRSAAHAASGDFRAALEDATKCEELAPTWPKALFRRGVALRGLKRFDMAISTFAQGQEQEPWLCTCQMGEMNGEETQRRTTPVSNGQEPSFPLEIQQSAPRSPSMPRGIFVLGWSDIVPCAAIAAFILITMGLGTSHTINEIFENIRKYGRPFDCQARHARSADLSQSVLKGFFLLD
eukprot:s552_g15.t3